MHVLIVFKILHLLFLVVGWLSWEILISVVHHRKKEGYQDAVRAISSCLPQGTAAAENG